MNDLLEINTAKISELGEKISYVLNKLSGREIARTLSQSIEYYTISINSYNQNITNNAEEEVRLNSMHVVAVHAKSIAQNLSSLQDLYQELRETREKIITISDEIINSIQNRTVPFYPNPFVDIAPKKYSNDTLNEMDKEHKAIRDEYIKHDEILKNALRENYDQIDSMNKNVGKLEQSVTAELEKTKQLYESSLNELTDKKEQINELLGHVSETVIAGDFEKNARDEKKTADGLRYASLSLMFFIVLVIVVTFHTMKEFNLELALFRISLTILVSVPAAYLARESAKHRAQQYSYLQTALDLKAITPYLASLPEEEQHKVKIKMADRIFAGKDFSEVAKDPYPLNTQEIIIELIKKLDLKALNSSDKPKKDKDSDS